MILLVKFGWCIYFVKFFFLEGSLVFLILGVVFYFGVGLFG